MVPFLFAGRRFALLPEGGLYWLERSALLVADLHLEKASHYARRGSMLPPYDSLETLERLAALVRSTGARELWALGDSFHDCAGAHRLSSPACTALEALTGQLDWTWIIGNHDPGLRGVGGRVVAEAEVDGLRLRHEADPGDRAPEISGHFHPKLRVAARGRTVARRCFVATPTKLVLPAFGTLTGGLDAAHPAIIAAVGRPAAALVALEDRLLSFPLAA